MSTRVQAAGLVTMQGHYAGAISRFVAYVIDVAVSSGAACTSVIHEPSHVLAAMGLDEDMARAFLRFGMGRFTTRE